MYVVAGITGNTGSAVARTLIERGTPVRALVRDPDAARDRVPQGVQRVRGDLTDAGSLARAFAGAQAAYVLNPPAYSSPDLFAAAERTAYAIARAVQDSGLKRLVVLSSFGAHLPSGTGIIETNRTFERHLGGLDASVTFIRPSYFMQNWARVAPAASSDGVLPSFLAPLDRAIPMVDTADIGRVAAESMLAGTDAPRIVELTGPRSYSPEDAAAAFAAALGRPVQAVPMPEAQWPALLEQLGFAQRTITAWGEMFRGFKDGSIRPEGTGEQRRAEGTLERAVRRFALR